MLPPIEERILEILCEVRDVFGAGGRMLNRGMYQETMGHLRDAIVLLENKKFGCATGVHRGSCDCQESNGAPIKGRALRP